MSGRLYLQCCTSFVRNVADTVDICRAQIVKQLIRTFMPVTVWSMHFKGLGSELAAMKGHDCSMNETHSRQQFQIPLLKGFLFLALGLAFFFAVYIPQAAILSIMHTDLLSALYFILEHGVLDGCFIIAAFFFMSARLMRKALPADLGLVQFPFIDYLPASWRGMFASRLLLLVATLALVVAGIFVIFFVQVQWVTFLHNAFNLTAPVDDLGLPALLRNKPIAFGVEIFVVCVLAPFAEEVMDRGFIFQWLAGRFGLWTGLLISSFFFAVTHWDLFGFANSILLGIFAALLLRVSRSLWPAIVLHVLWNVLFVLFAVGVLH
jgi:membrane protease YdiL (CAAX protease family)